MESRNLIGMLRGGRGLIREPLGVSVRISIRDPLGGVGGRGVGDYTSLNRPY